MFLVRLFLVRSLLGYGGSLGLRPLRSKHLVQVPLRRRRSRRMLGMVSRMDATVLKALACARACLRRLEFDFLTRGKRGVGNLLAMDWRCQSANVTLALYALHHSALLFRYTSASWSSTQYERAEAKDPYSFPGEDYQVRTVDCLEQV